MQGYLSKVKLKFSFVKESDIDWFVNNNVIIFLLNVSVTIKQIYSHIAIEPFEHVGLEPTVII